MSNPTGTQGKHAASGPDREKPARASGGLAGLSRLVTGHPWAVIAVWVIAAVAVIATAPALPTTTNEASFLPSSYETSPAASLQCQAFPQAGNVSSGAG